ncbi:MAG: guanylate kinase [bacterium]|nr:guanylate kinase [bacterium]
MSALHTIIIIAGPTGVGKTTVAKALQRKYKQLKASVTFTTRTPRPQAKEDKKVYFVSNKEFKQRLAKKEFLEWALVHKKYYGTHRAKTLELLEKYPVIFNIDVQGARQLMRHFPDNCISIFLMPESSEQIIEHIRQRGPIDPKDLENRLKSSKKEILASRYFDHIIVNNEGKVRHTINTIEKIILPYISLNPKIVDKKTKIR